MTYNKIQVAFGALKKIAGPPLQWQYNEKQILVVTGLDLPEYYAVDFCNEGDADTITMTASAAGVEIPDQFLLTGKRLVAYIVVVDGGSVNTVGQITFPVNARSRRTDISPTPAEQQQIDGLVDLLNEAAVKAIPEGGLAGQVLSKKTDDDYDTEWVDQSGGGGGGTTNYNRLTNKPQINGVELTGNKSTSDLNIDASGICFDPEEDYDEGTVGKALNDELNAIDQKQDATNYVTLSGTIVTQTGADNTMYLCGELAELTFTAPATGQTAIRFSSGTTPTVATFANVTWLNGFDPSVIEASKTYEINILNGLGCAAWT